MATGRRKDATFETLAAELKKGTLHAAYLIWGEEAFLRNRAVDLVTEAALDGATNDAFNLSRMSAGSQPLSEALRVADELPMMKARRVVVFDGLTSRDAYGYAKLAVKKAERDRLVAYLKDPSPTTVLVLVGHVVDKKQRFLTDAGKTLKTYDMSTPSPDRLLRWIPGKAAACGLKLTPDAGAELLEHVGASMTKLSSELEKLSLYCEEGHTATLEDVRALVAGSVTESIFDFSDAIGRRDAKRAMGALRRILDVQADGDVRILSELRRRFTQWLTMRLHVDRRTSVGDMASALRLPPFIIRKNLDVVRGFERGELVTLLDRVLLAERHLKEGGRGLRTELELLVLTACRVSRLPAA